MYNAAILDNTRAMWSYRAHYRSRPLSCFVNTVDRYGKYAFLIMVAKVLISLLYPTDGRSTPHTKKPTLGTACLIVDIKTVSILQ